MAKNIDILLDSNVDIMFADGDFVIGDSTMQNQYLILSTHKGEWKENPFIGAGLEDMLHDEGGEAYWKRRIADELKRDGMDVKEVKIINNGQININAEYK